MQRFIKRHPGFQKGNKLGQGRPKTAKAIPDMLRAIGDQPPTETMLAKIRTQYGAEANPATMREAMLLACYADAAQGNERAREFIADRTEGKVPQAQVNLNANQDTNDLTKMPLADILRLVTDLQQKA